MGEFSLMHWLVFGLIILLLFGPSRLPQLGQSLGQAIKGFKKGMNEGLDDTNKPKDNAAGNNPQQQGHLGYDANQNPNMRDVSHNSDPNRNNS